MKEDRRTRLETTDLELTEEERDQGYHFCPDWDFMLVGPNDPESTACLCNIHRRRKLNKNPT